MKFSLLVKVFIFFSIASVFVIPVLASDAMIWTDKADYSPEETVYISGSGFNPFTSVSISVSRPDDCVDVCPVDGEHGKCYGLPITDEIGSFSNYAYFLDGITGTYNVFASDGFNFAIINFTDAASISCSPNPVNVGINSTCSATGLGSGDRPAHIKWYDANNSLQHTSSVACTTGNCQDTYSPSTSGTWSIKVVKDSDSSVRASTTLTVNPIQTCGNGIVEGSEVCDSNSQACTLNGYTGTRFCNAQCSGWNTCASSQYCGDGTINGPEVCDDGSNNGQPNYCNAQCTGITAPVCGNAIIELGEQCDGGTCCNINCAFRSTLTVCREAIGACDIAETCTGSSAACPSDAVHANGYVCSVETGQCDADDTCDGIHKYCNENYAPSGTSCDDGLFCNINEVCDGNGNCGGGIVRGCSQYNINGVAQCDYDVVLSTFDYRNPFISECDEDNDECTTGDITVNHVCADSDSADGIFNYNQAIQICSAECDQDIDCSQSTTKCDMINKKYCTRDGYGTCNDACGCVEDEWNCGESNDDAYCTNCNHCGDGTVNCGEQCELGQSGRKCMPDGTSSYFCLNNVLYETSTFDSCKSNCVWDNCKTKNVIANDPRCFITLFKPSCGLFCPSATSPFSMPKTTFTTIPTTTATLQTPTFAVPKTAFSFPTFSFR